MHDDWKAKRSAKIATKDHQKLWLLPEVTLEQGETSHGAQKAPDIGLAPLGDSWVRCTHQILTHPSKSGAVVEERKLLVQA
jgi:hypothetical protein